MSLQKSIENAKRSGILNLKRLKKENISTLKNSKLMVDEVHTVDLSSNKLSKIPNECLVYSLMERLIVCDNILNSVTNSILVLKSLVFIDLSRNQLNRLPTSICQLTSLEILLLNNNQIDRIPEEINSLKNLIELDVSCNYITNIPYQIGDVISLRSLDLRKNCLKDIVIEISFLPLVHLVLSSNKIASVPIEFIFMNSLVYLNLEGNPLISPPLNICARGKYHIFRYLYEKAIKEDHKVISLQAKQHNRLYRNKNIELSTIDEFKFSNSFVATAIRKRMIDKDYIGYGSLNVNIVKRRNAFRSLTKDNDLTYKSTAKSEISPTSYEHRNKMEKETRNFGKLNNICPETSEGERNLSKFCKEKFFLPPARISKRQFNEHGNIQESITSFCTTSSVDEVLSSHLCKFNRTNNNDDDSQTNKIDMPKNEISIIEYIFIVSLPISFLVLSIYVLMQLIFNQSEKKHIDNRDDRSNKEHIN